MKKLLIVFCLSLCISSIMTSCQEKLKEVSGVVTEVNSTPFCDTVKTMKLYNGEDTLLFNMRTVRYVNGFMIPGDSVDVSYINGKGDTLRALLLNVKVKAQKAVEIKRDTTKALITK